MSHYVHSHTPCGGVGGSGGVGGGGGTGGGGGRMHGQAGDSRPRLWMLLLLLMMFMLLLLLLLLLHELLHVLKQRPSKRLW